VKSILRALVIIISICSMPLWFVACQRSAEVNQKSSQASPAQTSDWGKAEAGVQSRVTTRRSVEQGEPLTAVVELRRDPEFRESADRLVNQYRFDKFVFLHLSNKATGQSFTVRPDFEGYVPGGWPEDTGKYFTRLDGSFVESRAVAFPLIQVEGLPAGSYTAEVRFESTENPPAAGLWSGAVASSPFPLEVLPESPKQKPFLLPKRLAVWKELQKTRTEPNSPLVPIPVVRFEREDAEEVKLPVRNGHQMITKISNSNGGTLVIGGGPIEPFPSYTDSIETWNDYTSGDREAEITIEITEVAERCDHLCLPGPGMKGYRLLWTGNFKVGVKEKEFRSSPTRAIAYIDGDNVTDADLAMLAQHPGLRFLSLSSDNTVTDAGVARLESLTELQHLGLYSTQITDVALNRLRGLTNLRELNLSGGSRITDAGVRNLSSLTRLESLGLGGAQITDAGLEVLENFPHLKMIWLYGTPVGDSGMARIAALPELTWISLQKTKVTDAGVARLAALTNLKHLDLRETGVSWEGVNALKRALPDCDIEYKD
jgi:hypothetical protein